MRRFSAGLAAAALCVVAWGGLRADEEKVEIDKLPPAVAAAVKARFEGVQLISASKEVADGQTLYEVSAKHKGKAMDITVTPEGKVIEVETEIGAADAPKAVAD